jgi:hypothetical protein
MEIPDGYYHKATNESINATDKVSIHYSDTSDSYMVCVHADPGPRADKTLYLSKAQLELLVQAGTDTLEMDSR